MPADRGPEPVAVVGATATGKSALALALAEELGGEIVNADALQLYRGLDVGTAKPTAEERRRVPHHLLDVLDPTEPFSAGEFARRARGAIGEIRRRGRLPLVVGGSGFYLKALFEGLAPMPRRHPEIRRRLAEELERHGPEALHRRLAAEDPATAARLSPNDVQRVVRALEVVRASGVPLSRWVQRQPFGDQRLSALRIGLTLPRSILYDRIAARVIRMVRQGWVEEVERLLAQGLDADSPGFQAIGYRQLVRFLRGEGTLREAIDEIIRETRRFAKRQETWFRKEPELIWFSAEDPLELTRRVVEFLKSRGIGRAHA